MVPRAIEAFELVDEEVLEKRPRFDSLKFGEIDPPNWAVGAIQKRGGKRHPKREVQASMHLVPLGHSLQHSPNAFAPVQGPFGPHMPASDAQEAYYRTLERHKRKKVLQEPAARKVIAMGNLRNDDYRFWKGLCLSDSEKDRAICRWCEIEFKGREAMKAHHSKHNCKVLLLALYKYACNGENARQRYCFACKKETQNRHWGVPLCETALCLGKWKFQYNTSLIGMMQYKIWAFKAQLRNPVTGPFAGLLEDNANIPSFVGDVANDAADEADDDYRGTPC